MSRTEERLRDATTALARTLQPQDIPPLRLPAPATRPAGRRPSRAGRRAWLVPAAAAASVLAVAGAIAIAVQHQPAPPGLAGGCPAPPPPPRRISTTSSASSAGAPRFLVTVSAGKAVVRSAITGRSVASIGFPHQVSAIEGVAARPGDRIFYLAGAAFGRYGGRSVAIAFYRLTLGADGQPAALSRLPGTPFLAPLPFTSNALTTIPMAVSADGTKLAFVSGSPHPQVLGIPEPDGAQRVIVQDVATGTRHAFGAWPAAHAQVASVSWIAGNQLGFAATIAAAAVKNHTVVRGSHALNVSMVLNTGSTACGSSLIRNSRLITAGSASRHAGPTAGLVSEDAQTFYALTRTGRGTSEVAAISVATGQTARVLVTGPAADNATPMSLDGSSLLVSLSLRHVPHPSSGGSYVIGHLARINLTTGQVTRLPIPLYSSPQVPAPTLLAAW
ncbi:MAG TPA: hypothetical protein VFV41_25095 [Streptosporangiaceae bacterium]|nr:hypothetical protein [Streptosporangiaceae bacterium]